MEAFMALLNTLSSFIWGPFTLVLLLGVGIYLSLGLKLLPWRRIPYAFRQLMALPNLIALALLSPVIFAVTKEYLASNEKN